MIGNASRGEEEDGSRSAKRVVITEEKRLARLIQQIDADNSVVPRGAFVLNAQHKVIDNPTFRGMSCHSLIIIEIRIWWDSLGLSISDAQNPRFYGHLRQPANLINKSLLQREGLSRSIDFMDTIDEDVPQGNTFEYLNLCVINVSQLTTIRNLDSFNGWSFKSGDYSKSFMAWILCISRRRITKLRIRLLWKRREELWPSFYVIKFIVNHVNIDLRLRDLIVFDYFIMSVISYHNQSFHFIITSHILTFRSCSSLTSSLTNDLIMLFF